MEAISLPIIEGAYSRNIQAQLLVFQVPSQSAVLTSESKHLLETVFK